MKFLFFKSTCWLCWLLLFASQATLAGQQLKASTSSPHQKSLESDIQRLSQAQISGQLSAELTRQKTNDLVRWLNFAPVPDAINLLYGLLDDPEIGIVQKEAILFRLTHHLRSANPTPADRAVMLELTNYRSQILTEDHDHPSFTQPAFNIAASAKGALNEWRFYQINDELNGANVMQMWAAAGIKEQRYILTNLRNAKMPMETLAEIHAVTGQHSLEHPDLAMAAAYGSADTQAASRLGSLISSEMALGMLKDIASDSSPFSAEHNIDLLNSISAHTDPAIAGMAVNMLAKARPDSTNMSELINQLSDYKTGVNAAMTLAQIMTEPQLRSLKDQADPSDKVLQARIKLIRQLRKEGR